MSTGALPRPTRASGKSVVPPGTARSETGVLLIEEALLVKSLPDWSLTGFFSWRDLSQDIADEKHYFMVVE